MLDGPACFRLARGDLGEDLGDVSGGPRAFLHVFLFALFRRSALVFLSLSTLFRKVCALVFRDGGVV